MFFFSKVLKVKDQTQPPRLNVGTKIWWIFTLPICNMSADTHTNKEKIRIWMRNLEKFPRNTEIFHSFTNTPWKQITTYHNLPNNSCCKMQPLNDSIFLLLKLFTSGILWNALYLFLSNNKKHQPNFPPPTPPTGVPSCIRRIFWQAAYWFRYGS